MDAVLSTKNLEERAADLVEAAKKAGADHADAIAVRSMSLSVGVLNGVVEDSERAENDSFALRVFRDGRTASVSASGSGDPSSIAERAVAMAGAAPKDPYRFLPPDELLERNPADLDVLDHTEISSEALKSMALEAEEAALSVEGVTKSGGAGAGWTLGGFILASSNGFSGGYLSSRFSSSVTAVAGEGTAMERDYDFTSSNFLAELDASSEIGKSAGERAVARLNPRKLESRSVNVVYDPRASRSLAGHLSGAINGASIARGSSFLKDSMGAQIMAPAITIVDDPHRKRSPGSRPFDGEGVRNPALTLVEEGVLKHWLLDTASAAELGLQTNGRAGRGGGNPSPGSTNLTILAGDSSPEDLLNSADAVLYVTDMIGHGANGVTGDYSRGASGFWIENGERQFAVSGITIAGNLKDMFLNMTPASDLEYRYAMNAPTILVEGMSIAGV